MNFEELNWDILDRLRATFLAGKPTHRAYWTSREDLAQYDVTFGERIGWKWDAALHELAALRWTPPPAIQRIVDWGCGSGIAGRRVLAAFPSLRALTVFDHSRHAVAFASERASLSFPGLHVDGAHAPPTLHGALVVISHVCNELSPKDSEHLLAALRNAEAILWVEPGTHEVGRRIQAFRQQLIEAFDAMAPCPHQGACPLLAPDQQRHWCHQFAPAPAGVFTDGHWVRFARRAGIDLRSLPYSWLAMQRRAPGTSPMPAKDHSRTLGRPQVDKHAVTLHACTPHGLRVSRIEKRTSPEAYKALSHGKDLGPHG